MANKLAVGGLALFVLADVFLLASVVRSNQESSLSAGPEDVPATSSPSSTVPKNNSDDFTVKPAESVSLSLGKDDTLLRAVRGECAKPGTAKLELADRPGKEFKPLLPPVSEILSIRVADATSLIVVGTDATCTPRKFQSADRGITWIPALFGSDWYFDPRGITRVTSPTNTSKPGCNVVNLSALDKSLARVTCTNGDVMSTGNAGKKWAKLGHLDGLRQGGFPSAGNGYALAKYGGCAAQSFTTRDGARTWSRGGCIAGESADALAFSDTSLVAQVSGLIFTSNDRGETWSTP